VKGSFTSLNLHPARGAVSYAVREKAAFHSKFIVEHVIAAYHYKGIPPQLATNMVRDALQNLLIVGAPFAER